MDAVALIRRTREHLKWANHRLLDAAEPLRDEQLRADFAIGAGSLLATLTHLYAAERVWLGAIRREVDVPSPFDIHFDSLGDLRAAWLVLDAEWDAFLLELTEADLDRPVVKKSTSSKPGQTMATPLGDVLLHVATHASYTMAQAKNIMRQLGVEPLPDVMLITLSRQQGQA